MGAVGHGGHDHAVFSRVYGVIASVGERTGLATMRSRLLADASGRLLVIGLGPGHDLDHLPPSVTSVVAVEPSGPMRQAAAGRVEAARARGVEVEVLDAVAESLPLDDASVDAVLTAFVLCSVDDLAAAAGQAHRVLRPGGALHVLEHVAAPAGSRTALAQRVVGPVWPRLTGGCRADRRTRDAIVAAGFDDTDLHDTRQPGVPVVAPLLVGTAVRR